jgi:hypothetical protein
MPAVNSENKARKFRLEAYLKNYGPQESLRRAVNN